MVHNIETKLNYPLMNLTGHIYICNAQKLPILSRKSMATLGCLFSDLYASSQLSKSGLLWPLSEIRPATCFCTALELRMAFTCLNNWGKKSKEEYSEATFRFLNNYKAEVYGGRSRIMICFVKYDWWGVKVGSTRDCVALWNVLIKIEKKKFKHTGFQ